MILQAALVRSLHAVGNTLPGDNAHAPLDLYILSDIMEMLARRANHSKEMMSRIRHRLKYLLLVRPFLY